MSGTPDFFFLAMTSIRRVIYFLTSRVLVAPFVHSRYWGLLIFYSRKYGLESLRKTPTKGIPPVGPDPISALIGFNPTPPTLPNILLFCVVYF